MTNVHIFIADWFKAAVNHNLCHIFSFVFALINVRRSEWGFLCLEIYVVKIREGFVRSDSCTKEAFVHYDFSGVAGPLPFKAFQVFKGGVGINMYHWHKRDVFLWHGRGLSSEKLENQSTRMQRRLWRRDLSLSTNSPTLYAKHMQFLHNNPDKETLNILI